MKPAALDLQKASNRESRLGVATLVVALFLAAVDSTIVSTALPSISRDLGRAELYPWIMSGFLLPVALVAPLAGACADRWGISAMLKAALVLFVAASAGAALSVSMPQLIAARVLQGAGAGAIITLSYALLASLFDAERRGKMQGMLSSVWGLSAVAGPLLGSVLDNLFGWRAIFWFNLPLGLAALLMMCIAPRVASHAGSTRIDLPAQTLLIVLLCSVLLLISESTGTAQWRFGLLLAATAAGILLVARLRPRAERSPVPLEFLRQRALLAAGALVLLSSAGLYASVTLLPLAWQQFASASLPVGMLIMMAALGWVVGAAICGGRLARAGYRLMAAYGMLLLGAGCLAMPFALSHRLVLPGAAALALIGLGMGFTATTTLVFAQNRAPVARLGTWTSTVQFLRNLGAALGINALGTLQLRITGAASFQTCFTMLGVLMLAGLAAALLLPARYDTNHA
jgi:MFS family permease